MASRKRPVLSAGFRQESHPLGSCARSPGRSVLKQLDGCEHGARVDEPEASVSSFDADEVYPERSRRDQRLTASDDFASGSHRPIGSTVRGVPERRESAHGSRMQILVSVAAISTARFVSPDAGSARSPAVARGPVALRMDQA
jgi:hypothetical protein